MLLRLESIGALDRSERVWFAVAVVEVAVWAALTLYLAPILWWP